MTNFSELYNKYIDILFAYGCRMTTDRELIKDCIHDVFVKYFTKHEEGKVLNVGSYLVTALRNRINDEFRMLARTSNEDASTKRLIAEETDDMLAFEKLEAEMDAQRQLMDNIAKLPPRQQQIINLYYMERRKYDEICSIMGINYQSVRNLMHRSITNLRKIAVI